MAVLTLSSTMPTHCTLHKHILCVCVCGMCVHQRGNTLLIFTEGNHRQCLSTSLWGDPEVPSSAWSKEHIHTNTGHYTHLPDERERERPCNFEPCGLVMDCHCWQGHATNHRQSRPAARWRIEGWGCWHGVCPPVLCVYECVVRREEWECINMSMCVSIWTHRGPFRRLMRGIVSNYIIWFCPRGLHNKTAAANWPGMNEIAITPKRGMLIGMKY